jgi:hypothetical protein
MIHIRYLHLFIYCYLMVGLILGSLFDKQILMVMCVVFVKQDFGKFMGIGRYFVG